MQNIRGDVFSDILLGLVFYPFVAVQLHDEALAAEEAKAEPAADA